MSESKSKDEMSGDELRKDGLEKGLELDDSILDDPIVTENEKPDPEQDQEHDTD